MLRIKQKWGLVFLLLLSLVYVFIFLLDFYSANETKVKEIYFADRITVAHKILIDKYNVENKGKVKVVPIDFSNFDFNSNERKELLARSLRGRGDGIDLFGVDLIWVQRFAKWCESLEQYFPVQERSQILDNALESCYYNGELVAVPLNLSQAVLYYREDIINKLTDDEKIVKQLEDKITWEDFIVLNKKLNANNPFYIFPAADYEGLICSFMELVLSLDPNYFENYNFNLSTPIAEKSLNLLVDMVSKYSMAPEVVTNFTEIPSYEYFIENDGLFIRGWQTYDKDFIEQPFNVDKQNKLKKTAMPYFKGGKQVSVFGGWNVMISKFSDKKDEVIKFVKYLLSDESQEIFYKEAGYHPVNKNFYKADRYKKLYPEIPDMIKMQQLGIHRPAHTQYTRYSKIMSNYIELAIRNEISVKEALSKITNEIRNDKIITKEF